MHYHCEVVMPPTENVVALVEAAMKPFNENGEREEGDRDHSFWDFYSIGGRFSGRKMMASFSEVKLAEFKAWLISEGITVSSVTCGKQELSPASQSAKVDLKWNEMFPRPDGILVPCPLFRHANDPYNQTVEGALPGDICRLDSVPDIDCARVIFVGPAHDGGWEPTFMLSEDIWNGVNHMPVAWDGKIRSAVALFEKRTEFYKAEWRAKLLPKGDWLCVTVDYHS